MLYSPAAVLVYSQSTKSTPDSMARLKAAWCPNGATSVTSQSLLVKPLAIVIAALSMPPHAAPLLHQTITRPFATSAFPTAAPAAGAFGASISVITARGSGIAGSAWVPGDSSPPQFVPSQLAASESLDWSCLALKEVDAPSQKNK